MNKEQFYQHIEKIFNGEKPLSYSSLSKILKSPRHYYEYVTNPTQTESMIKGVRFHEAILEPEKFKEKYVVFNDDDICNEIGGSKPRATRKYAEWKDNYIRLNAGKEFIEASEMKLYENMKEQLIIHDVASQLLFNDLGINENVCDFEYDGFKIMARIDRMSPDYTVDLKKVKDADYSRLKWDIERMNYDLQGFICSRAAKTKCHYLIFIDEGCHITIVQMGEEKLDSYQSKFENAIESFIRCAQSDDWHKSYNFYQSIIRI